MRNKDKPVGENLKVHIYAIIYDCTLRIRSQYFRPCDMTKREKSSKIAWRKTAVGTTTVFQDLWGAQRRVTDRLRERPCYGVVKAPTG